MLVFDAIEEETKEKAVPMYMALKIASMILKVEDNLPTFEEFIKREEKTEQYQNRDPEAITRDYVALVERHRKARE